MTSRAPARRAAGLLLALLTLAFAGQAAARCEGYAPQPKPQNVGRIEVGQDYDAILDRGFMTFAVYEDFPPWSWEEKGEVRGVDVELGRMIAAEIGVEPRFNLVGAGENVQADLRVNVWKGGLIGGAVSNVMMHVPYDPELACRVEQVVLHGRYHRETVAIAYREDAYPDGGPTPAYFRFDKVAVENDTISDFYLSTLANGQVTPNMTRFPTTQEAMQALGRGEVVAAMGARAQLEHAAGPGVKVHAPPLPGLAVGSWTLGVAVRHTFRQLGYAVDDAIRAVVADGRLAEVFERHGLTYASPDPG